MRETPLLLAANGAFSRAFAITDDEMANAPHNLMRPAPIIISAMTVDEADRLFRPSPTTALALAAAAIVAEVSGFTEATLIYVR